MSKLRLAYSWSHPVAQRAKRPILTWYNGSSKPAHSCTPQRALVSAVKRIVAGDYKSADVYDQRGNLLAEVKRHHKEIDIRMYGVLK